MTKNNVLFVLVLTAAALLFGGIIVENYRLTTRTGVQRTVNIEAVRRKIQEAGLQPTEARYWVVIE
ncbi:MAG: hypothetical protein K8I00_03755 [Candidatus Omnitrophica bacterium]|nr:hypothetical protein [Candidatus Omnitrophota bacterium]